MKLELRTMRTVSITLAILLMISIAIPAMAHHSAAAQDFTKRVEVDGVVKSWRKKPFRSGAAMSTPTRSSTPRSANASSHSPHPQPMSNTELGASCSMTIGATTEADIVTVPWCSAKNAGV